MFWFVLLSTPAIPRHWLVGPPPSLRCRESPNPHPDASPAARPPPGALAHARPPHAILPLRSLLPLAHDHDVQGKIESQHNHRKEFCLPTILLRPRLIGRTPHAVDLAFLRDPSAKIRYEFDSTSKKIDKLRPYGPSQLRRTHYLVFFLLVFFFVMDYWRCVSLQRNKKK